MNNPATPKEFFIEARVDDSATLKQVCASAQFRQGVVFAFSHMAWAGATKEQLDGARKFVEILVNLGDAEASAPQFPDKSLRTL